jgi:hypothetical protein
VQFEEMSGWNADLDAMLIKSRYEEHHFTLMGRFEEN